MLLNDHRAVQDKNSETAYLMLKISMDRYQCSHDELQKEQQVEVLDQAFKLQQLNRTILSSSQAKAISVTDTEVESALKQIMGRYENCAEFERAINQYGISRSGFKELLAAELKVNAVLEAISNDVVVTGDEVENYYNKNQHSFHQPEMRKVRHILITVNEDLEGNSWIDSQLRISLMANEIDGSRKKFEDFAAKKSECPTALHGGLIGTVPRGKLYPELDAVLFEMQTGAFSEPIETELGFHLLWCEAVYPERIIPLSEVEYEVKNHLRERKRSAYQKKWIARQVHQAKVNKAANH